MRATDDPRDLAAAIVRPDPRPESTRKPKRRTDDVRQAAAVFKHVVCSEDCLMEGHGPCEFPLQAAHVVPAQTLRERGLAHLIHDPLNGIALCYRHHRRHDGCVEKIARHHLPARCLAWAEAHSLTDALERRWPA